MREKSKAAYMISSVAEQYRVHPQTLRLYEREGLLKPSRDPRARAKYLSITGGGGFLLYLQMHENPTDLRAVLRDYARDMVLPALELYTDGLMADSTMYDAFLAADDQGGSNAS